MPSRRIRRQARRRTVTVVAMLAALVAVAGMLAAHAVADQVSSVTINDVTVNEGDSGTTPAVFTLTLTQPSRTRVTVSYNTYNQTAIAPGDYTPTSGQVVFAPGVTTRTVSVDVVGDTRYEGDETFELTIGSADTRVPNSFGTATIVDDDARPYVSVGDTSATEGDTGTTSMVFPVTLDRPSGQDVRVRYETTPGTAGPSDYQYTRGTLTIPAGQTSGSVTVPIIGDTIDEGDYEYFFLALSQPVNAVVYSTAARGTIIDDDRQPRLSVLDSGAFEGSGPMVFKIVLDRASPNPVTAFYNTYDQNAIAGRNYTSTRGSLTFTPGQTQRTVSVPLIDNGVYDPNSGEPFGFAVSSALGATLDDNTASGWIADDDRSAAPPGTQLPPLSSYYRVSVGEATVVEPDTGSVNEVFTVAASPPAAVSVSYTTSDNSAVAGDYTPTSGTVTTSSSTGLATVKVPVLGDDYEEADERFLLTLSNAVGGQFTTNVASGWILNDDVAPVVSVSDLSVAEGDTGSTAAAAFEMTLSTPSLDPTSVSWATQDYTATAPADYTAESGTVIYQPGETTQTIHVPIVGDTIDEADEQFTILLTSSSNAIITEDRGTAVILDDDRNPGLAVSDTSVYEGTGSNTQALFTVTMSAPSANTVTVNAFSTDGSAVAPGDYTTVNTTVTFAPGQTVQTVPVTVIGDSLDENDEYMNLRLGSPVNAYITDSFGYLDILDDDTRPSISIGEGAVLEPDSGTVPMTFPVTLSTASLNSVTVNWNTFDQTAVAPSDYQAASGTLTFAPGQTTQTITVNVVGDTIYEGYQYFGVNLTSPTMATLLDTYSYGGIYENDVLPQLAVDNTGVAEGNSGSKTANFTVSLQPASPNTVTVHYSTVDNNAVAGSDYTATSGTLTFAPGVTSMPVAVLILGDTSYEPDESFGLRLDSPVNAGTVDATGYLTILNDDKDPNANPSLPAPTLGPVVAVSSSTVVEGSSGTTNAVFTVRISPAPTGTVNVDYQTVDYSATAGSDYTAVAGSLVFTAGQTTKTVTVPVATDQLSESLEQFFLRLMNPSSGAQFGPGSASNFGTILDDDHTSLISIGDTTVNEGSAGRTTDAAFTIRLLTPAPLPVQVDWATTDGTAVAPRDYTDSGGTVTFAPGQTTQVVHVPVNGDDLVEGDENFSVYLTNSVGGNITSTEGRGVGTILDSDAFDVLGAVTNPAGVGASGTTITVSGNAQPTQSTLSDAAGSYEFDDLPDGRYTLTPSATGAVFVPATYTVDVRGGSLTGLTFIATAKPTISGRITDAGGNPVPGVTVTRKGNSQATVTTTSNGAGYYVFAGSPAGSYTIKPSLSGATFTPAQATVKQTATNAVTADFAKS